MVNENIENKVEETTPVRKAEVTTYLDSMVDLTHHDLEHSQNGKDAYNCDPCDGCGPNASFADVSLYESLHKRE
jgi:hypothetical protein